MTFRQIQQHALFCVLIVQVLHASSLMGADDFADLKTITVLPITEQQIRTAFDRSLGDACEQLPTDQPLEMRSFTPFLTDRDRRAGKGPGIPATRQSVLSVGLSFSAEDRAMLPKLSGGRIADYLEKNCVLIQARVRKDMLDRKLYFHHRPLAATAQFRGSRVSHAFEPIVAASIKDFHGIGLFVEETRVLKAEKLRTLVLIFKNNVLTSPTSSKTREQYEFAFIRGREGASPDRLDHHLFVTTDDRKTLHYMNAYSQPQRPSQCSILGNIAILDYDSTGLYPKESATRDFRLSKRATFSSDQINDFCANQKLEGGMHANLTKILDAAIDGRLDVQK